MAYQILLVEIRGRVGLITLNRPKALNALSGPLIAELELALDAFEADDAIGAIVVSALNQTAFRTQATSPMQRRSLRNGE